MLENISMGTIVGLVIAVIGFSLSFYSWRKGEALRKQGEAYETTLNFLNDLADKNKSRNFKSETKITKKTKENIKKICNN